MPTSRPLPRTILALAAIAAFGTAAQAQQDSYLSWTTAGNGMTDNHFAADELLLGTYSLPYLQTRWIFTADGEVQGTPTVTNDQVYFADAGGSVWRVNATTGKVVWKSSLPAISGDPKSYSRNSPAIAGKVVLVGDQDSGTLYALSRSTGELVWKTVLANDQGAIITSSPVVLNNTAYVGVSSKQEDLASSIPNFVPTFRGSIAAIDLAGGQVLWQTYVIPQGYTGGAVWSSNFAIDTKRSALYITTGNNYSVPASVAACQAQATTPAALDACLAPNDYIDSILSLNLQSGNVNWAQRLTNGDTWTVSCIPSKQPAATPCPSPAGLDTDFGAGPNLFSASINGTTQDLVGAGQKSGSYFTLNRDTGAVVWGTQVSPDGTRGGIEWGTATDGQRIYVPSSNANHVQTTLIPSGVQTNGGSWSALDPATGKILWQTPTFALAPTPASGGTPPPAGSLAEAEGSIAVANGVVFGEDSAGNFVALDAATGQVLRSVDTGGAGVAGPAIAAGSLYWSSGYADIGPTNNKVFAISLFGLPF